MQDFENMEGFVNANASMVSDVQARARKLVRTSLHCAHASVGDTADTSYTVCCLSQSQRSRQR